jgi:hypothetical protein
MECRGRQCGWRTPLLWRRPRSGVHQSMVRLRVFTFKTRLHTVLVGAVASRGADIANDGFWAARCLVFRDIGANEALDVCGRDVAQVEDWQHATIFSPLGEATDLDHRNASVPGSTFPPRDFDSVALFMSMRCKITQLCCNAIQTLLKLNSNTHSICAL